jgi:ADP-dependent NAD(P)H-hydrate dehydratase / NAD(P)H-hydrate epimerase
MAEAVKEKELRGLIERNIYAGKGDAGRILIIGGSEQYVGAAVLAGLAALRSGADSVIIAAPETSARLMNAFSPDLITVKLRGDDLDSEHLSELSRLSENATVVLIGPGLGISKQREEWLAKLLPLMRAPVVLDADATKQVKLAALEKTILFANKNEYEFLKEFNGFTDEHIAPSLGTNVLVIKGREDRILTLEGESVVSGGHARATVAGTGDVLAGMASAFYAQMKDARRAAQASCVVMKKTAERLGESHEFGFLASDMVNIIPSVLKDLRIFRISKYEPKPPKKTMRERLFKRGKAAE